LGWKKKSVLARTYKVFLVGLGGGRPGTGGVSTEVWGGEEEEEEGEVSFLNLVVCGR